MLTLVCSSAMCLHQNNGNPREVVPTLERNPYGSSVRASCGTCGAFLHFVDQNEIKGARVLMYAHPNHFEGFTHVKERRTESAAERAKLDERIKAFRKRAALYYDSPEFEKPDRDAEARKRFAGIGSMVKSNAPSIADERYDRELARRKHEGDLIASVRKSIVKIIG